MNSIKGNMNTVKSTVFGLFFTAFAVALVVTAPVAHAQDDSFGGDCCGGDYGSSYIAPDDYGSSYIAPDDYGSSYIAPNDYTSTPATYSGGYTPSYATSPSYASTPYASMSAYPTLSPYSASTPYSSTQYPTYSPYTTTPAATPSCVGNSCNTTNTTTIPTNTTDNGNTSNSYNPCATPNSCSTYDNGNTSTYSPYTYSTYSPYTSTVTDNGNTTDSNNSCVQPGSCSSTVDDHSVVNANTTISSPVTITTNNPPAQNTQIVYNSPTPAPYVAPQTYYPTYTPPVYQQQPVYQQPVYQQPVQYVAPQPVVTYAQQAATPYITLSQAPDTGLDLGPFGTVIYWSFLVLACLGMAYLIVVKRAHMVLASTLKSVVFGTEDEESTEATSDEVPAQTHIVEYATPAFSADVTDEFILSQVHRA